MYNSNEIQEVLPHRAPFLMVDEIVEIKMGEYAVGTKNISISDPVFQGHFPDQHVYPGVLLIESMAQVGAFVLLLEEENRGKKAYFTKIKNARFYQPIVPGDKILIKTELLTRRLNVGFAKAEAHVGERLVAKAEIAFALEK